MNTAKYEIITLGRPPRKKLTSMINSKAEKLDKKREITKFLGTMCSTTSPEVIWPDEKRKDKSARSNWKLKVYHP